MGLFSKKPSRDDVIAQGIANQVAEAEAAAAGEKKEEQVSSGNPKLDMELVKIKAQLDSFGEIRKANSERFSRIGEQMGELRGMILDTNKTISKIEVSATKAIDLVESVQPEKLMIEMRKIDGKVESLRANIESNESMMRDLMDELKKMRQQMNFYKGIEQVAKLNEEVKGEILEIKKVEATIERHADKGETIFLDMEKKFAEYEKFQKKIDDMDGTFHVIQGDFDKIKMGVNNKADKKEFITLMDKFTEFEKHTSEVLKLLDERNKQGKNEIKDAITKMKRIVAKKHGLRLEDIETIGSGEKPLPELKITSVPVKETEKKEEKREEPHEEKKEEKKEEPVPAPAKEEPKPAVLAEQKPPEPLKPEVKNDSPAPEPVSPAHFREPQQQLPQAPQEQRLAKQAYYDEEPVDLKVAIQKAERELRTDEPSDFPVIPPAPGSRYKPYEQPVESVPVKKEEPPQQPEQKPAPQAAQAPEQSISLRDLLRLRRKNFEEKK